jgi:hypothetical protein
MAVTFRNPELNIYLLFRGEFFGHSEKPDSGGLFPHSLDFFAPFLVRQKSEENHDQSNRSTGYYTIFCQYIESLNGFYIFAYMLK